MVVAEALLNAGANPNVRDESRRCLLAYCCGDRSPRSIDLLRVLLNNGADPNTQPFVNGMFGRFYKPPLEQLKLVLLAGADVNRVVDGRTALHGAAKLQWHKAVPVLILAGANIFIRDTHNRTAMQLWEEAERRMMKVC